MGEPVVIAGVHFVRRKLASGISRWYVYAWRGGPCVMTADGRRKPSLTQQAIDAVSTALKTLGSSGSAPKPTILLSLIREWRSENPARASSPEWEALSTATKKTWGSVLNHIEAKWGAVPLQVFEDSRMIAKIIAWRDSRRDTPRAADNGITVLKALLKFGLQRGRLSRNVAVGIGEIYIKGQRAEIVWTEADLKAVRAVAEEKDLRTLDAIDLAGCTGLRRDDLATLTWDQVKEFSVVKRAAKSSRGRRRFAAIPRIDQLNALLERLREVPRNNGVETVLVTSRGKAWNLDTLSKQVSGLAKKAAVFHVNDETGQRLCKHLHDIRGTFATRLMTTTDLTDREIAGVMGWSEPEIERVRGIYVDDRARTMALGRRIARGL